MHFRTNKKRAGVRPASCLTVGLNDWKLRKLGGDLKKAFLVQLLLYDVGSHLAPAWTKKLLFYAFLPLMRPRHQVRPTGGSSAATHRAEWIICQNLFKKGTFKIRWTKKLLFFSFLPLMRPQHQVRPTGSSSAATHRAKGIICQMLFKKGTFEISWTKKLLCCFSPSPEASAPS